MIHDFSAQDWFLLASLYLVWGMIVLLVVAIVPYGKKPRFSLLITWPFVLLAWLLALVWYGCRQLLGLFKT